MPKKYLIGFYRKRKRICALYSESRYFFDRTLNEEYEARIVPLGLLGSDQGWVKSEYSTYLKEPLLGVIEGQKVFATVQEEASQFFLLMYTAKKDKTMARVGVLLEKKRGQYKPIIVNIDGYEHIVELKGAGCPIGGFPKFHLRRQAGAYIKGRLRITGGLSLASAKSAFERQGILGELKGKIAMEDQIKPLAYVGFCLIGPNFQLDMGMLLRLTPTSIRYSFTKNPAIDELFVYDESNFVYNAGRETAKFLLLKNPSIHRNNSKNNMAFISSKKLVLTDFEELVSPYEGHYNLDFPDHIYPYLFSVITKNQKLYKAYLKGFGVYKGALQKLINKNKPSSIKELNELIFREYIALSVFRKRIKEDQSQAFLQDNIHAVKSFVSPGYFKGDLRQWVKKDLLPKLESQFKALEKIDSDIEKRFKNTKQHPYGEYVYQYDYQNYFMRPYKDIKEKDARIQDLKVIIEKVKFFLKEGQIEITENYVKDTYQELKEIFDKDAHIYLYPFIIFLSVWLYNERRILEGVEMQREKLNSKEKRILDRSLVELGKKEEKLRKDPDFYYKLFVKGDL